MESPVPEHVKDEHHARDTFEIAASITIAVLATILSIVDFKAGRYAEQELVAHNEKASAYAWFQSKSIKEDLATGQRDLLSMLLESGAVRTETEKPMRDLVGKLEADVKKYGQQKDEIQKGSRKVGEPNWAQPVEGKLGQVVGASEWERKIRVLEHAHGYFDAATFFLQISLVLGAVSLVLSAARLKWTFYGIMVGLGVAGSVVAVTAFALAAGI